MSRIPIVVVLGSTGTGKSKLAIKIAKKFRGEIISADSMQVYEGLNIVSNKVTESEKEGIPHYLLDICKPTDRFSVLDFRNRTLAIVSFTNIAKNYDEGFEFALKLVTPYMSHQTLKIYIDDLQKRGKLPIIVGGTSYYVESVLWNTLMEAPSEKLNDDSLIFNRCRIVNDATKLRIDKWKTYSKKTFMIEKNDLENFTTPAESQQHKLHCIDVVEVWCQNIVELETMFEDLIRDTISMLRLDFSHYRRTFYRLSQIQNQPNASELDLDVLPILPEDCEEIAGNFSIEMVVEVEKRLLNQLLLKILERCSSFLDKMSNSDDPDNVNVDADTMYCDVFSVWNEENMNSTLLRSSDSMSLIQREDKVVPCDASFDIISNNMGIRDRWRKLLKVCDVNEFSLEDDQKNEIIEKGRNIMNEMQNIVHKIIDTRVKRLALLRIIDDENMVDYSTEELHSELKLFDDKTANILHPNDRRKIIRAIQLFMSTGKTVSELRKEQCRPLMNTNNYVDEALDEHGLSLRYPNALVLWLRCDQDVLNERLTLRVDEMISSGLIGELEMFHQQYNLTRLNDGREVDYTKGIFQLIGLKEFHSYLMLSVEDRQSNVGLQELRNAVERLKRTNIQYSKSQNRHVFNRFINVPDYKQIPLLFELNCTDSQKEDQEIDEKAFTLIENYLKKETTNWWYPYSPMARISADPRRFARGEFVCNHCQRLFTNQHQLSVHNASRSHQKCVYKQKIRKLRERMSTVNRPSCHWCNSDEDVFVDIPWEEWNLN